MAADPADIAALTALNAAIASGEKQVAMGGQQITYRSITEMLTARNDLQRRIDAAEIADGTKQARPRQFIAYHAGRGF